MVLFHEDLDSFPRAPPFDVMEEFKVGPRVWVCWEALRKYSNVVHVIMKDELELRASPSWRSTRLWDARISSMTLLFLSRHIFCIFKHRLLAPVPIDSIDLWPSRSTWPTVPGASAKVQCHVEKVRLSSMTRGNVIAAIEPKLLWLHDPQHTSRHQYL